MPAQAEEPGAWVIVDSSGNAVSQAIVCTPSVCGDPNSAVSKDLLKPGQRFVLQTNADSNGNVAGIGASSTPNIEVKVDIPTNEWTITTKSEVKVTLPEPVAEPKIEVTAQTTVIERINPIAPVATPLEQKAVVTAETVVTPPAPKPTAIPVEPTPEEEEVIDYWAEWQKEWALYLETIWAWFAGWWVQW
jgi:hypothetical protein